MKSFISSNLIIKFLNLSLIASQFISNPEARQLKEQITSNASLTKTVINTLGWVAGISIVKLINFRFYLIINTHYT